ncbi:MAG: preprotein translocase subunit TatC [SAR86 cluster bacterium BACL1 MAG-121105-bin34]|jgi:sec-independent protein translocase protein TatC|uniref:Sec-independent protein translocase protein TatC n=2 Tax=SAR86 cluster TaxID=62672 RepID=A0A0R2UCW9_9GAMM|nr:MAG: preprotein translocase subunit TatC [SAR86 cluster bacterium BACL1 MAG-120507-bin14]KRO40613.1 MAG: preprotein translocase subunit TatC [SAR86 cluster bacterium BACL1 MAG-120920-bin57]KRO95258.1 MAG: preprotein translocase subunit TatC [SAR86 cluster bacterium BACL1 MAG-120820-bin45]KRO98955.1 MAG: preprotein translocase subunit TatC [SAR86 cluster bacterium BACL1 MAG-120823-bin87]KRP00444.1 MAG: preprotein translocase subunit TatC [SAR86 cluster bacterium BACL1 MAG-120813-bin36]KRP024|tara:strand:+ start:421 stop:1137 length:717 start_codon:yes stop_codon:yes gene_type:complete
MNNPNEMSYIEHLKELRSRLLRVFVVAGIFLICCLPFANEIYFLISSPLTAILPENSTMIATEVTSPFIAPLRLAIYSALILSMPYSLFELWGFIAPGLYKSEKTFVLPLLISSGVLFYAGVAFAFFVVSPIILNFFIAAAPDSIQVMTDINKYLDFVLKLFFAFGLAFEIPVATFLIISTGITNKKTIKKIRPYLIIGFFVLAMLLTPPDIFSQLFLAIPMWLLFEIGLLISRDKKN